MTRTCLLIDDSTSLRLVLRLALEQAGWQVLEAANGATGLAWMNGQKVDAVVCDLHMPEMDGLEFLRCLRRRAGYERTPAVILTVDDRPGLREQAHAAGAQAWIVKPVGIGRLADVLERLCAPAPAAAAGH